METLNGAVECRNDVLGPSDDTTAYAPLPDILNRPIVGKLDCFAAWSANWQGWDLAWNRLLFGRDEDVRSSGFVESFTTADPRSVHFMAPPSRPGSSMPPTPKAYGRGSANPSGPLAPGTPSGIKTSGGKTGSLVESPLYEDLNLTANNIYYRDRREPLPQHVANLVQRVQRERTSPTPSVSDALADEGLAALERGAGEPTIEQYFQNHLVAQTPRNDPLKRSDKAPFQRHAVPNTGTQHRVSNPTPNVTSGYNLGAFTAAQKMQLGKTPNISAMNNEGMCFPFFILEFKGDGPSSNGSLVAMNGTEARLFISWKQQDLFNVQNVRSFALQEPDHFIEFRKYVRNIIDWGRDERL
ncbi:hypothetical protein CEP51_003679 [Fusarium floridanum]|uniref:DUF7924 domain-containing protein n=1 Tax=Fusarium floridanum TaxID=1325733 RepID=A0A428S4P4_9HYPO|nr:hypothetical protein CEP51_003679 [Fusarium floridanum]